MLFELHANCYFPFCAGTQFFTFYFALHDFPFLNIVFFFHELKHGVVGCLFPCV